MINYEIPGRLSTGLLAPGVVGGQMARRWWQLRPSAKAPAEKNGLKPFHTKDTLRERWLHRVRVKFGVEGENGSAGLGGTFA